MSRLQLKRHTGTSKDSRGATIVQYAQPVDLDGFVTPRGASAEETRAGYENYVIQELSLHDFSLAIDPKDVVLVDGEAYQVEGKTWNFGSWNPFSDFGTTQVALKRVEG